METLVKTEVALSDIEVAAERVAGAIKRTPFLKSRTLSDILGCEIWLKFENLQFTASFKERGALNRLLHLNESERKRGVIAMSAGNHAQGVAYHAARLGIPATIVMPEGTPEVKVVGTKAHGAEVILEGTTLEESAAFARDYQEQHGLIFIHPYDDPHVIAGQGTITLEIVDEGPTPEVLIVPVGGGGLLAGNALAMRALSPTTELIGVQSALYPSMAAHFNSHADDSAGGDSLAEGIAVKSPGKLTARIIRETVDDIVIVSEAEIEQAVTYLLDIEKTVAEGAGAAGLAAILHDPERYKGKRVGLIICGGNIDLRLLGEVLNRELVRAGRRARLSVDLRDRPGELATLTRILAEAHANVLEVFHHRVFTSTPAKGARTVFEIETRDRAHLSAVIAAITDAGYEVSLLGAEEV
ncbi:MAG: threonine ammonia-lyase [Hyphomicrobiales bacterium]